MFMTTLPIKYKMNQMCVLHLNHMLYFFALQFTL